MIKLICPQCNSDAVNHICSELLEEDCFQCEECNNVFAYSEAGWEGF